MVLAGGAEEADVYSVDLTHDEITWTPEKDFLSALKKRGLDLEPIPCGGSDPIDEQREQWTDGANAFAVAPGRHRLLRPERADGRRARPARVRDRPRRGPPPRPAGDRPEGRQEVRHPALDDRAGPGPRRPALHDDAPREGAASLTRRAFPRAFGAAAALLAATLAACGGGKGPGPAPAPASGRVRASSRSPAFRCARSRRRRARSSRSCRGARRWSWTGRGGLRARRGEGRALRLARGGDVRDRAGAGGAGASDEGRGRLRDHRGPDRRALSRLPRPRLRRGTMGRAGGR